MCAERWKTAFNKFADVETQINRIESIMIGVAGTLIVGGVSTIGTILSMHPVNGENMIKGYETKDVKASKTKAKPVEREEGVIFSRWRTWCFKWGNGQETLLLKNLQK